MSLDPSKTKAPAYHSARNAVAILAMAAGLLLAYSTFLRCTGIGATLAESNLQANLIRSSKYLHSPVAPVILVGSSVAGRLLPEYFSAAGLDIRNLGLDGSRPLFAFEVLRMKDTLPEILLVDTSTLFQPLMANDVTLREALNSPSWKIASALPFMRPESRPSSILYSWVKAKKELSVPGKPCSPSAQGMDARTTDRRGGGAPDWRPEDQYPLVRQTLAGFQTQGIKVILLSIPRGLGWGNPSSGLERRLADELGLQILEPGPAMAERGEQLGFSDGMHLDVPSAERVAGQIASTIRGDQNSSGRRDR